MDLKSAPQYRSERWSLWVEMAASLTALGGSTVQSEEFLL
jgi:hypothetical protein